MNEFNELLFVNLECESVTKSTKCALGHYYCRIPHHLHLYCDKRLFSVGSKNYRNVVTQRKHLTEKHKDQVINNPGCNKMQQQHK